MNMRGQFNKTYALVAGIIVAVILIAGATLSLYGTPEEESLKVGTLNTMTGDLSFVGTPFLRAEKLAIKGINDAGGVLGKEVELANEDTKTTPNGAVDAARKLADVEKVDAIVGSVSTPGTMAIVEVISSNKIPTISPSATAPKVTDADDDDYLFRTCPSDTLQGAAIAKVAVKRDYKVVNILSRNDAYGRGLEEIFSKTFEKLGGTVSQKVLYNPSSATFNAYLDKAKQGDPDAILLNGLMEDGARMLRKAADTGITDEIEFLCSEGVQNPKIPDEVGKNAEGKYIVWTANAGGATPYPEKAGTFADSYLEEYGEEPMAYCANAYDSIILLALASEKAGSTDGEKIKDALREVANAPGEEVTDVAEALKLLRNGEEINYQGASSKVTFDEHGDTILGKARKWYYSEDGKIVSEGEIEIPEW